jgi:CubicO group peptidase (beta-lactamase class C family)
VKSRSVPADLTGQNVEETAPSHRSGGWTRRGLLGAGLAAGAALVTGCGDDPTPAWRPGTDPSPAATTTPPPPARTLAAGTEERLRETLTRFLAPTPENPNHATYAGAVALVTVDGAAAAQVAVGDALRYKAGPVELPPDQRVAMRPDSVFDLASVTKVYTTILTLQQVDRGRLDLAAPVADVLPAFGRPQLTPALLLAHTSGLPVGASVSGLDSDAARRAAVLATPLIDTPGRIFRYSSVGLMVLAQVVEQLTGQRLDRALAEGVTGPMGLAGTGFRPTDWMSTEDIAARMVATDARSSRGLLRGVVHDDVCDVLGGIAGHAGIFAPAADLAAIGSMLLNRGLHQGRRILSESIVDKMLVNQNRGLPATDPDRPQRTADHGLGVELNQPWFMGRLAGPRTFGHTGFTGTSLLVAPEAGVVLVLLTNRAHPNWSWANPDPVRAAVADVVAGGLTA